MYRSTVCTNVYRYTTRGFLFSPPIIDSEQNMKNIENCYSTSLPPTRFYLANYLRAFTAKYFRSTSVRDFLTDFHIQITTQRLQIKKNELI